MKFYHSIDSISELDAFPRNERKAVWKRAFVESHKKDRMLRLSLSLFGGLIVGVVMIALFYVPSYLVNAGVAGLISALLIQQLQYRHTIPFITTENGNNATAPTLAKAQMTGIRLFLIIIGFFILTACWIWRPPSGYNIEKVDSRLRALTEPFQRVTPHYYPDDSVGVEIVDKNNKVVRIAIPADLGDANQYTRFYIGALHDHEPEAQEVTDAKNSRHFVEAMLVKYSDRKATADFVILSLRHRTIDFFRCAVHGLRGELASTD